MDQQDKPSTENRTAADRDLPVVGRRERVGLPEWGIRSLIAKVDTGARTSAIHVENVRRLDEGRIHFEIVTDVDDASKNIPVETRVIRDARVKPSSGRAQERPVVETLIQIGAIERRIEITLVSRRHMLCRMLLGRRALEGAALVDVSRRYVQSARRRKKKKEPQDRESA